MGDEREGREERPDDVAGFVFGRDDAGDGAHGSTGDADGEVDSTADGTAGTTDEADTSEAGDASDLFDPDAYDGRTGGRRGSLVGGAVTIIVLLVALGYFTGPLVLTTLSDVADSGGPDPASPPDDRRPTVTARQTTSLSAAGPAVADAGAGGANVSTTDRSGPTTAGAPS